MRSIYLPIRSFGDFIITAAVVKNNFSKRVPIIIPDYVTDIFEAIHGSQYFEPAGRISYKNQPAFFELYKVRDITNIKRLVNDVLTLRSSLDKTDRYILDYSSRRISFTGAYFAWPSKNENIYEAKLTLLREEGLIKLQTPIAGEWVSDAEMRKVIIVPDSRISEKNIDTRLINCIINAFEHVEVKIARFLKGVSADNNVVTYSSFPQLIQLISSADMIISAESLPYHLANYLDKPHFVIYNQSRHFKSTFMTPYMLKKKSYTIYTGNNKADVIADIARAVTAE